MTDAIPDAPVELGLALVFGGLAGSLAFLLVHPDRISPLARYREALDRELVRALQPTRGRVIVRTQIGLSAVLLVMCLHQPLWVLACVALWWLPPRMMVGARQRRTLAIEAQLDGFLIGLTSALRTAPALGDAIGSTLGVARGPLRAELSLVLRQFRMGVPLDEALLSSARRVGSPSLSAVVATLRIARRTGGTLSTTLERNAHTLREMARLEGVVRAKTASGRAQANAISVVPVVLVFGLYAVDASYLAPLMHSAKGHLIAALTCALWVIAIWWAHRIVAVDV